MVRPDTDTTAPALVDMEGIDVSDDEQNNPDPGTRIDRQSGEGIDDSDESGESSDDETGSADGEYDREEDGAEEVEDIVGRTTVVPGSAASILSNSVSSPNRDFTGQQQQQQQQHVLPNVERERVAAVVDQDLQGDALQHAVPETISGIEATEDEVPQDDSLPKTESEELHLGSVDTDDRPLMETKQPMEAHDLIDEGVFYEAEKVDMGMDTSLAYSVAHHPQPEEEVVDEDASRYELVQESSYSVAHHPQPEEKEEDANRNELVQESSYSVDHHPQPEEEAGEDASRNELVQESRMLTDIEDPSEHWKGDPLQHLESEIPMLELTLSPPIEPYRVLRRQSSVEDFVDAAPTRRTREGDTRMEKSASGEAHESTQGYGSRQQQ
ncbi:hypothetical protein BGZ67_008066 [Mortierella alpina]|nr:hypothetical protein BGZ67_008066 [Mortierella alpina]